MCGIAGILKLGNSSLNAKETVISLLSAIQHRGTDAVGVAWEIQGDNNTYYVKRPGLVANFNPKIPSNAIMVMGHVRAATHGGPENPENNHPLYGERYVITHNGVVSPKKRSDYHYKGQTDTEIMLSYVEKDGWDGIPETPGSKSVAVWDMDNKELFLYTSNESLYMIIHDQALLWCSEEKPLIAFREKLTDDPIITKIVVKPNRGYIFKPLSKNANIINYTVKPNVTGFNDVVHRYNYTNDYYGNLIQM